MSDDKITVRAESRVFSTTLWQGPLPPPESAKVYEEITPGALDRILTMAEKETAARHELTMRAMECGHRRAMRGQLIGALVALSFLGGALVCAFLGQTAIGVAIAGVTLVGIVNALANPRRGQK